MSETPILDGAGAERVPLPESGGSMRFPLLVGVAAGLALSFSHAGWQAFDDLVRSHSAAGLLTTAVLAYAVTVVIHELGHCAAGLMAGLRLAAISFGPVGFSRSGDRWRMNRVRGAPGWGGGTAMVPRATAHLRWRMFLMVAGGPLATLASAGAALAAIESGNGGVFFWLLLAMAAITLLLALIPHGGADPVNDGTHLWKLCRAHPAARMCAILALWAEDGAGKPPEQWSQEWLRRALGGDRGPDAALGELFGYWHHIAGERPDAAARHLERALSLSAPLGPPHRAILYLEAAFVHGWWRRDGARSRAWFDDARRLRVLPEEALSGAETAVLLGEGRIEEAKAKSLATLAFLDRRGFHTGLAFSERRWLKKLLELG